MVIQSNMSPKAIAEVWESTAPIFEKYDVALVGEALENYVKVELLKVLLIELNDFVGSSSETCIEGG